MPRIHTNPPPCHSTPDIQYVDRQVQLSPSYQPQLDVNLADGSSKRGVGKTCSGVHNIGLALMRLEHVEKAMAGEPIGFKVKSTDLLIRPFIPSWWSS
jgi:hypothetical protein